MVDTGDKFFAGGVDTAEQLINIHSRISPRIFEKIQNGPNGILGGLGDTDSRKKPEVENLVSDSQTTMKTKGGQEGGKFSQKVSDDDDRGLFDI